MAVKMSDVARRAGVSVFTVSCALRGLRGVSEGTARRVRAVAEEMGYCGDPAARLLAARRRPHRSDARALAVALIRLAPPQDFDRMRRMDNFMRQQAEESGFILHCIRSIEFPSWAEMGRVLWGRGVEGLVISANNLPPDHSVKELNAFPWHRFALVKISRGAECLRCHTVATDAFECMHRALVTVAMAGYRRILIWMVRPTASPEDDFARWGAILAFKKFHGPRIRVYAVDMESVERTPPERLRAIVRRYAPDAVIGFPASWMLALESAGFCAPRDFAFLGLAIPCFEPGPLRRFSEFVEDLPGLEFPIALRLLETEMAALRRGFPEVPQEHVISPKWQDGETFPLDHKN